MPFRSIDPLTDRARRPDELRRLDLDLEKRGGTGTMWPWIVGILGVIGVVTLVYGFPGRLSTQSTDGVTPTSVSKVNPSTPSSTSEKQPPDSAPR